MFRTRAVIAQIRSGRDGRHSPPHRTKIGLLQHAGSGNLGDDATLHVVMQSIRQRCPDAVVNGLTMNPEDTIKRHGCVSYPITRRTWSFGYEPAKRETTLKDAVKDRLKRYGLLLPIIQTVNAALLRAPREIWRELLFLVDAYQIVRSFNFLIISGGGQLTEKDGAWAFPYTIFKWVLLAKAARVRCVFLNVGAGPLNSALGRWFVARALGAADYVSFRDAEAQALAHAIGFTGKSHVFPDCVYKLAVSVPAAVPAESIQSRPVVGIAPMPYCDPRVDSTKRDQGAYEAFIANWAEFAVSLVDRSFSISVFGTDIGVDPLATKDVLQDVQRRRPAATLQEPDFNTLAELLAVMSRMDYVITCRFHGIIFAHLLNKPVVALSPHPKVMSLMQDLGLAQYCLDIRHFSPENLMERFERLVRDSEEVKKRMAATATEYGKKLEKQFDGLYGRFACEQS